MKKCRIELIEQGSRGDLYSLHYDGEEDSVFDAFINDPHFRKHQDFSEVIGKITRMLDRQGFVKSPYLKPIGKPGDSVFEIKGWSRYQPEEIEPHAASAAKKQEGGQFGIRLFCLRFGEKLIIITFAGTKSTQTIQENPEHDKEHTLAMKLDACIAERIKDGDIYFEGDTLQGDLTFDLDEL